MRMGCDTPPENKLKHNSLEKFWRFIYKNCHRLGAEGECTVGPCWQSHVAMLSADFIGHPAPFLSLFAMALVSSCHFPIKECVYTLKNAPSVHFDRQKKCEQTVFPFTCML